MKQNKKPEEDEMDKAYKMLDASPSSTGVSDAAKGEVPENEQAEEEHEAVAMSKRLDGEVATQLTHEIQNAYSMLFEALAIITKADNKSESKHPDDCSCSVCEE